MLSKKRSLVRGVAWAVFLIACVAAEWAKIAQNDGRIARVIDMRRQQQSLVEECQDAFAELTEKLRRPRHGGPMSLEQVEQVLPDSPTLRLIETAMPDIVEADWVHPVSGVTWSFRFDADDRLIGWKGSAGPAPAIVPQVPFSSYHLGEEITRAIASIGRWAWVVVFVLFLAVRRWRAVTTDLLLAFAVVCTTADAVFGPFPPGNMFSNDALYIDALMIAVSLAVMAAMSPRIGPALGEWLVPRRYSVRWLMGLTAVVAILISFRWHGMVVGSVLAVGAAVYWAFRPRVGKTAAKNGSAVAPS